MSAESETSSNVTAEAMNGDRGTPLVSVIVPVYGVERYLDACVEGLVGQTYRNLEILLVDDGSPDRCPAMCDAWTARDERIRVIHKANGGLSDARNVGLAKATGDYIYFVDSDDMVERNLIERAMATMRDYDADLVMFQFDTISEDGKPLTSSYKHNHYDDVIIMTPVEAIKAQVKAEIASRRKEEKRGVKSTTIKVQDEKTGEVVEKNISASEMNKRRLEYARQQDAERYKDERTVPLSELQNKKED